MNSGMIAQTFYTKCERKVHIQFLRTRKIDEDEGYACYCSGKMNNS